VDLDHEDRCKVSIQGDHRMALADRVLAILVVSFEAHQRADKLTSESIDSLSHYLPRYQIMILERMLGNSSFAVFPVPIAKP